MEVCAPAILKNMFISGANKLNSKRAYVDELNVFPVPDGDTGTNMNLTITSAVNMLKEADKDDKKAVLDAMSSGSLRGARGNSGVILSQILRGFCTSLKKSEDMDARAFAQAFDKSAKTAYKAVMKPKEGTILTVIKETASYISDIVLTEEEVVIDGEKFEIKDLEELFRNVVEKGNEVLANTPNLLPVLKQAGVVDSGGQGLMYIFEGMYDCLKNDGRIMEYEVEESDIEVNTATMVETEDITFGYCTEFIVNVEGVDDTSDMALELREYLSTIGNSIVAVGYDGIIKIHVHTNEPGTAIQKALSMGYLTNMKIDNMREEHKHRLVDDAQVHKADKEEKAGDSKASASVQVAEQVAEKKKYGFVAISSGSGLSDIFRGLGVDVIVEGGQTMNPSTDDILSAVEQVNAENVFIFPNNKNIILAANQAKSIEKEKNVMVIESKYVTSGLASIVEFDEDLEPAENVSRMTEVLDFIKSGQVTYAIRDTEIDEHEIKEGDILGLVEGSITAVDKEVEVNLLNVLDAMIDEESELVSIYYGADVKKEDVDKVVEKLEEKYDELDFEVHFGGQPLYYYFVSVE